MYSCRTTQQVKDMLTTSYMEGDQLKVSATTFNLREGKSGVGEMLVNSAMYRGKRLNTF